MINKLSHRYAWQCGTPISEDRQNRLQHLRRTTKNSHTSTKVITLPLFLLILFVFFNACVFEIYVWQCGVPREYPKLVNFLSL